MSMSSVQRHHFAFSLCLAVLFLNAACVSVTPEVYLVDRHTVMETEAAGEWPALEQRFIEAGQHPGPIPLAQDPAENSRRERAFRVLNGEFVTLTDDSKAMGATNDGGNTP